MKGKNMKLKIVWVIAGAAIVIGGIIHFFHKNRGGDEYQKDSDYGVPKSASKDVVKDNGDENTDGAFNFSAIKAGASEKMSKRHEEAEKVIRDSVSSIFGDAEAVPTKNERAKKNLFDDLNNM